MKDAADLRAAALDLAAQFQLPPDEVETRVTRARDASYWRGLSNAIAIGDGAPLGALPIAPDDQAACDRFFQQERYFQSPPIVQPASLASMNAVIDAVVDAGWPAVWAVVSDQFWQCARLPAIAAIVRGRLGAGYAQASQVWIHVVPAVDRAGGWMPHFDGFRDARVTVWIALTDATPANGCMYLVPPSGLPAGMRTMDLGAQVAMTDVLATLHGARALPAPAGAAIGWDFDVLHWGGRASNPSSARRAISLVFVGGGRDAEADEAPLLPTDGGLPPFEARVRAAARAIKLYGEREPIARRFLPVARRLEP